MPENYNQTSGPEPRFSSCRSGFSRGSATDYPSFEDIAQALSLALKETAAFVIYPIVSDNETPWVDQGATRVLDYEVQYLCTSDGVIRGCPHD